MSTRTKLKPLKRQPAELDEEAEVVIHKLSPVYGTESTILCLSKKQIERLRMKKGDYVKCSVQGNKLIVEKIDETSRD
jgi:formylmethanofuran dehydrogenase subunit D